MASIDKHWWGVEIALTHKEACLWTSSAVNNLGTTIASAVGGAWGALVASIVVLHKYYIRDLNVRSGGKGVILKFSWAGVYLGAKRRGTGTSPCS
jgi:hypothetical protein